MLANIEDNSPRLVRCAVLSHFGLVRPCSPMDCSLPGSTIHGVLQARILEWVPSPGDLPNPGIKPPSLIAPALAGGFFTTRATFILCK